MFEKRVGYFACDKYFEFIEIVTQQPMGTEQLGYNNPEGNKNLGIGKENRPNFQAISLNYKGGKNAR